MKADTKVAKAAMMADTKVDMTADTKAEAMLLAAAIHHAAHKIAQLTNLQMTAGANISTMNPATITAISALKCHNTTPRNVVEWCQNTIKYKNAEWFHSTTAKHAANNAQNTMMYANAVLAKRLFANKNAVMFLSATGNISAAMQIAQHLAHKAAFNSLRC
jgi:hypothetical protein